MSDRIPDPVEAAPGVWSVALPFPNPLHFAFTHLVRVDSGIIAVDIGWDSDEGWDAFRAGLRRAGADLADLVGVVITHAHPDHYGLVERVRVATSAWVAMHPAEHPAIARQQQDRIDRVERMAGWLRDCGAPQSEFDQLDRDAAELVARISFVWPDHDLVDGDAVPATYGSIRAVHTPGHTPGHLCYYDSERNLLFTGDHILPRVTPNISKRPLSDADPLGDFVHSIDKVRRYGGARVLPGHDRNFDDLNGRLDALAVHHEQRLDAVERAVHDGARTVWEASQTVPWRRPFESLDGRARRSALGETYSHLVRLTNLGRLVHEPGQPLTWRPVSEPGS